MPSEANAQNLEALALYLVEHVADQRLRDQAARQVRDAEACRWDSGDLSAEWVAEFCPVPGGIPKTAVRMAVALLYDCTDGTVRQREYVCRTVPPPLRAAWQEEGITFSYWKAIAQARPRANSRADDPKREAILDLCWQFHAYREAHGRKPFVSEVWGWVGDKAEHDFVWRERLHGVIAGIERVTGDEQTPAPVVRTLKRIIPLIERLIDG
jgi:hypothetical protein